MPWFFRRRTVRRPVRASGQDWIRVPPLEPVVNPQPPALGPVLSTPDVAGTEGLLARADADAGVGVELVHGVVTGVVRRNVAAVPPLESRRRFRVFRRAEPRPADVLDAQIGLEPRPVEASAPADGEAPLPGDGSEGESSEPIGAGDVALPLISGWPEQTPQYIMPLEVQELRRREVPVVRRERAIWLPLTTVSAEAVGDPAEPAEPFRSIGPFERMLAEYEASDALGIAALAGLSSVAAPPPDPVITPRVTTPPAAPVERPTLAQSRRQGLRAAALKPPTPDPSDPDPAAAGPYSAVEPDPEPPEPEPSERWEAEPLEVERWEAERLEAERLEDERLEDQASKAERVEVQRLEVERFEAGQFEREPSGFEPLEQASESLELFTAYSPATRSSTPEPVVPDPPQPEPTASEPPYSEVSALEALGDLNPDASGPEASGSSRSALRALGASTSGVELSAPAPWLVDAGALDRAAGAASMTQVPAPELSRLGTSVLGTFGVASADHPRAVPQWSAAGRTTPARPPRDRLTTSTIRSTADLLGSVGPRGSEGPVQLVSPSLFTAPSSTVRRTSSGLDLPALETSAPGFGPPLRLHPGRDQATAHRSVDSFSRASTPDRPALVPRSLMTEQPTGETNPDEFELWSLEAAVPELAAALQAGTATDDHTALSSAPSTPAFEVSADEAPTALVARGGGEAVMKRLAELEGSLRELSELVTREWDADWLLAALSEAWLIERVADRLYPAVRRRLRGELLIDRERRGVLADLR